MTKESLHEEVKALLGKNIPAQLRFVFQAGNLGIGAAPAEARPWAAVTLLMSAANSAQMHAGDRPEPILPAHIARAQGDLTRLAAEHGVLLTVVVL